MLDNKLIYFINYMQRKYLYLFKEFKFFFLNKFITIIID